MFNKKYTDIREDIKMKVPYSFTPGKYSFNEISNAPGDSFNFILDRHNILSYQLSSRSYPYCFYRIELEFITETLSAEYDESGRLRDIWFDTENEHQLMYINFSDKDDEEKIIMEEAARTADEISEKLLKLDVVFSRIFIERFFDGDSHLFCANYATPEMVNEVIEQYGSEEHTINNSGNYDVNKQLHCDDCMLEVMFACASDDYYDKTSSFMIERIKAKVVDKIRKSEDFQFVDSEFD